MIFRHQCTNRHPEGDRNERNVNDKWMIWKKEKKKLKNKKSWIGIEKGFI